LQLVGVTQAVAPLFTYCPAAQATGAADPPAQNLSAGQLLQYKAVLLARLTYVPAAQTATPSQTQAVEPALGTFPVPHKTGVVAGVDPDVLPPGQM